MVRSKALKLWQKPVTNSSLQSCSANPVFTVPMREPATARHTACATLTVKRMPATANIPCHRLRLYPRAGPKRGGKAKIETGMEIYKVRTSIQPWPLACGIGANRKPFTGFVRYILHIVALG